MAKPDLDTVTMRRAALASEFAALDNLCAEMEREDGDLAVAERALNRLVTLRSREAPSKVPSPSNLERRDLNGAWPVLQIAALIALVATIWLSLQRPPAPPATAPVIRRSVVIGPNTEDGQQLGRRGLASPHGRAIRHPGQGSGAPEMSVTHPHDGMTVLSEDELEAISQAPAVRNQP